MSFIETGRTQPSRQALLVLAESLDVPLRERNRLLEAGGFAHVFTETPLAADEMAQVRSVLQFILDRHVPYAAVVLDRYPNCLMGNGAAGRSWRASSSRICCRPARTCCGWCSIRTACAA